MPGFVGLRLAREGDEARLFDLCVAAHQDNGWDSFDAGEVRFVIGLACLGEAGIVFAIADGPERIEAAIGLKPIRTWYGDGSSWAYEELLVFVHPLHRRSRHAFRLLRFAQWWKQQTGCEVILNLMPRTGLLEKARLFLRFGKIAGLIFRI